MAESGLSRKEREYQARQSEILDAAEELFSQKGFHNVSMQEIAQKAEFAVGSLYKFFKSKEELYTALVFDRAREFHRQAIQIFNQGGSVLEKIRSFLDIKGRLFKPNIKLIRLYLAETSGLSFAPKVEVSGQIEALYDEIMMRLSQVMQEGVKQRIFRNLDPYYLAYAIQGMSDAFLRLWMENPEQDSYEENMKTIESIFYNGVLNQP